MKFLNSQNQVHAKVENVSQAHQAHQAQQENQVHAKVENVLGHQAHQAHQAQQENQAHPKVNVLAQAHPKVNVLSHDTFILIRQTRIRKTKTYKIQVKVLKLKFQRYPCW